MDNKRMVWWNGVFCEEKEARISIYSSQCMWGDMVFEMTRSFGSPYNQFKLKEHVDRLYNSAKYLRIDIPITKVEMIQAVHNTIEVNIDVIGKNEEHRIMINVDRGLLGIYDGNVDISGGVNIIIADFPLRWTVQNMGHLFDTGINACIPSQRAIPARLLEPKVKNRSRAHYLQANIDVSLMKGEDNWALLLDEDGYIAEGTGDNFFIVKNNVIYTPEGRNILRGISRDYIFELAGVLGFDCIEKNIEPYDVLMADEAFMTGTPFCILPVTKLNGQKIGDGNSRFDTKYLTEKWSNINTNKATANIIKSKKFESDIKMGKVTATLLHTWSSIVGVDIMQQIKDYSSEDKKGVTPYQF